MAAYVVRLKHGPHAERPNSTGAQGLPHGRCREGLLGRKPRAVALLQGTCRGWSCVHTCPDLRLSVSLGPWPCVSPSVTPLTGLFCSRWSAGCKTPREGSSGAVPTLSCGTRVPAPDCGVGALPSPFALSSVLLLLSATTAILFHTVPANTGLDDGNAFQPAID